MSVASLRDRPHEQSRLHHVLERAKSDAAYQAFVALRTGFALLPIVMGIDKFFNNFVNWEQYLAHWIWNISPWSAVHTMHVVGIIEIAAGVLVALKPRYFAYLVAVWLGGIVVNLLTYSGYYDIALRDGALMLAALTLARLASKFDPPIKLRHRD
ncbi:MAG: DoxX family protein [Solirubrobacteraceae bacterium]